MEAKHTPGTMSVHATCVHLHNEDGGYLSLDCAYAETAKEIARRWNAHDELLAALKQAVECVAFDRADPPVWGIDARAALAKAEGRAHA